MTVAASDDLTDQIYHFCYPKIYPYCEHYFQSINWGSQKREPFTIFPILQTLKKHYLQWRVLKFSLRFPIQVKTCWTTVEYLRQWLCMGMRRRLEKENTGTGHGDTSIQQFLRSRRKEGGEEWKRGEIQRESVHGWAWAPREQRVNGY